MQLIETIQEGKTYIDIDFSAEVAAGNALLDHLAPGWWDKITIPKLDLNNEFQCILGQLIVKDLMLDAMKTGLTNYGSTEHWCWDTDNNTYTDADFMLEELSTLGALEEVEKYYGRYSGESYGFLLDTDWGQLTSEYYTTSGKVNWPTQESLSAHHYEQLGKTWITSILARRAASVEIVTITPEVIPQTESISV